MRLDPTRSYPAGDRTFSLNMCGYLEAVSSDHATAAPDPLGDPQKLIQILSMPQNVVRPEGHQHTGKEFFWEAFVGHYVSEDGTLRLWTGWWGYG